MQTHVPTQQHAPATTKPAGTLFPSRPFAPEQPHHAAAPQEAPGHGTPGPRWSFSAVSVERRPPLQLKGLRGAVAPGRGNETPGGPPGHTAGLPAPLQAGLERLSGLPMGDVRVHYQSHKPAQLRAFAYTQGTDIYVGPGQERHLPHESWHVVQQKQGVVRATGRVQGVRTNDDPTLEHEADVMGTQALQGGRPELTATDPDAQVATAAQREGEITAAPEVLQGARRASGDKAYLHPPSARRRGGPDDTPVAVQPVALQLGVVQRKPLHFPSVKVDDQVVRQYGEAVYTLIMIIDKEVERARAMALNWELFLNHTAPPHLKNWAESAQAYFQDPYQVPDFLYARFGYAIETLACQAIPTAAHGLSISFQVASGVTRPDIVVSDATDTGKQIAWIDITSEDSAGHVLGKSGAGWKARPFVYEILYAPLQLREVLAGMKDPLYKEIGEYQSQRNQITQEEQQKFLKALRDSLVDLQNANEWQTGFGNAAQKRGMTRAFLQYKVKMNLGQKSTKATKGALALAEVNDGPFGFNAYSGGLQSDPAQQWVASKAAPAINERQKAIDEAKYEELRACATSNLDKDLLSKFTAYSTANPGTETMRLAIALKQTFQMEHVLHGDVDALKKVHDHRAGTVIACATQHITEALLKSLSFDALHIWIKHGTELHVCAELLPLTVQKYNQFSHYLQQRYPGNPLFGHTKEEHSIIQGLATELPWNNHWIAAADGWMQDHPLPVGGQPQTLRNPVNVMLPLDSQGGTKMEVEKDQ